MAIIKKQTVRDILFYKHHQQYSYIVLSTQLIPHPVLPPWQFQNNGSTKYVKQLRRTRAEAQSVPEHFLANLKLDRATYVYGFCVTAPHFPVFSYRDLIWPLFIFYLCFYLSLLFFFLSFHVFVNYVASRKKNKYTNLLYPSGVTEMVSGLYGL